MKKGTGLLGITVLSVAMGCGQPDEGIVEGGSSKGVSSLSKVGSIYGLSVCGSITTTAQLQECLLALPDGTQLSLQAAQIQYHKPARPTSGDKAIPENYTITNSPPPDSACTDEHNGTIMATKRGDSYWPSGRLEGDLWSVPVGNMNLSVGTEVSGNGRGRGFKIMCTLTLHFEL